MDSTRRKAVRYPNESQCVRYSKELHLAGANKILKAGQVVFKAGEAADGMYLVRKGELVVYLEQDGKEVVLAKIGEGGMIGEMALFDRQPRSASVKASADSEITLISLDDFTKLMKQIPKWFVGLMTALSGRLRTTNDRLKQVEASAKGSAVAPTSAGSTSVKPFQNLLRMVYVLELLWHRDGTKEGKEWCLQRKLAEDTLTMTFGEAPERVKALTALLISEQIVATRQDQYKNVTLALTNRGSLRQLTEFISAFTTQNPNVRAISEGTMGVLKILHKLGSKAPYEQFTCSAEDIIEEAKASGVDPSDWGPALKSFITFGETLKVVKSTSKSGIGIRIVKESFPEFLKNISIFNKISAAKLDC